MKYKWDMNEENWHHMQDDVHYYYSKGYDVTEDHVCYGSIYAGDLCAEFELMMCEGGPEIFATLYQLHIDRGYGSTEDNTPYDCLDDGFYLPSIKARSFVEFRQKAQQVFLNYILDANLLNAALSEDGWVFHDNCSYRSEV